MSHAQAIVPGDVRRAPLRMTHDTLDLVGFSGGASRDRTDDLRVANATLSQLSYGPIPLDGLARRKRPET
jgi:hypothetical protein